MAFKPNDITKENILDAIKKIEKEQIDLKKATRWHVIIDQKPYPPKEVMKYAHEQMNGDAIWNYGGGEGTNKYLKKFGFEMVDLKEDAIQKLILEYKKHIQETQLNDEKYKWQLLSQYGGRPNLNAENLLEEIKSINFANLIYALGKAVVFHLINEKPDEMRLLFKNLFNEDLSLTERIKSYNIDTLSLYRSIGQKLQHHQDERTIGTYLTFHNPDKYTFYKYSFYKKMCELLNEKEAKKNEKYEHYLSLVNRIIEDYIQDDTELIDLTRWVKLNDLNFDIINWSVKDKFIDILH